MSHSAAGPPAFDAVTEPVEAFGSLLALLAPRDPLLFVRRREGIAGIGVAARLEFSGPDRIRDAAETWRRISARSTVRDQVGLPGSGLVAFGAFTFSDASECRSVLIIPRVVLGRRDGVCWVTRIGGARDAVAETPFGPDFRVDLAPGAMDADGYRAAVDVAVRRVLDGRLEKVVLARDLTGRLPDEADLRLVLGDLALSYPDTWTFAVDGLIGSSPETLVQVRDGTVTARVLAGSTGRGADAASDEAAAVALATSTKDIDEHRFAVESVVGALRPHVRGIAASELPFALKLPNLWHLASDVEGPLGDGSSSLDLAAALHPTAAVAGTPRQVALALIDELEPFDRCRYGGPVGWVDAAGDGTWAISLRSAEIGPDGTVTAFAGAGILAESVPDRELAETTLKFRPIVEAFG